MNNSQTAVSPLSPSSKRWILTTTILGSAMVFINGASINVALPAFQTSLNASVSDIQWIINAYTLFLASLILLGGSLGDHWGRRKIFLVGVLLFTLASLACGLSQTAVQLIVARALQGVGGALLTPGSLAIITATFPDDERGAAIGLWSGFSALASAVGPLLGGWLIDTFSWRWLFFIYLPIATAVFLIAPRFVPESHNSSGENNLDWLGATLATLGLGATTFALIEASNRSFTDPLIIGSLAVGLLLLVLFVWLQTRLPFPMVPPSLFQVRSFSGANGLTFLLYMALSGALFFLPLNLIQVQDYTATQAGAAFLPIILLISALSRWSGSLVDKVGARLPLTIGSLLAAIGYGLMMWPGVGGSYWLTFFPALVMLGLGMALSIAPLTTTVMKAVPKQMAGTASGINNAASRIASLLAVALLGIIMLSSFSQALAHNLRAAAVQPATATAVLQQHTKLAAIVLPPSLPAEEETAVRSAVQHAFVRGFRLVNGLAAMLALGSALIAALTIESTAKIRGKEPNQ